MKLIQIDKARYRRHLNRIIIACVISLALGSLGISQLLIALFPDESGSHFYWNLTGVLITSVLIGSLLNKYRHHEFMTEVTYVWNLKQVLNKINRKMRKLKDAAREGDAQALLAIHYSHAGSRLLWQLDDNMILEDELIAEKAEFDAIANQYNLSLDTDDYDPAILKNF